MCTIRASRRFLGISLLVIATSSFPASAQRSGGGNTSSTGSPGAGPTRGTPSPNNPNNPTYNAPGNNPNIGQMPERPIFLSGRVSFDDGSAPNPNIRIERVCGGTVRLEAHTDTKGRFYFQVGQNNGTDVDASDQGVGGFGGQSSPDGTSMGRRNSGAGLSPLGNCELRASYPGYRSDSVNLMLHDPLESPELGTIILHRLGNVQGTTMSATTLAAPKHAQKEYDKGMQLVAKGKMDDAEAHLQEATETYPKYAIAWFALGKLEQQKGKTNEAHKAYESAIAADGKYVSPYDQLAFLSAQQQKWDDAADYSKKAIDLNPVEFPSSFWYNAIANYQLKRFSEAERSARQLIRIDTVHQYPEAENMLAQILLNNGNATEAAAHLKAYLALAPNAKDAAAVKDVLAKLEQTNPPAAK